MEFGRVVRESTGRLVLLTYDRSNLTDVSLYYNYMRKFLIKILIKQNVLLEKIF